MDIQGRDGKVAEAGLILYLLGLDLEESQCLVGSSQTTSP